MANEAAVVHVVDDDEAIRDSIGFLLSSAGHEARLYPSARALLARASALEAGCILTDIRMPDMNGLELVQELKRIGAPHPIIVLTGHADVNLAVEAMRAGVQDFIEKPFDDEALLTSIRHALQLGEDLIAKQRRRAEIEERLQHLTPREKEVFDAVVAGMSNKVAALKLGISPRTVEIYRANVMSKMQANTLSDLVRMALQLNPQSD